MILEVSWEEVECLTHPLHKRCFLYSLKVIQKLHS